MKHTRISHLGTLATLWMLLCGVTSAQAAAWEIFAMDNGVGRGTWSPEKQASVLKEIGFDGISYNYTHPADLRQWLTELKSRNLRLHAVYLAAQLEGEIVVPATLAESVLLLRGSGAVLWLIVPTPSAPGNYGEDSLGGRLGGDGGTACGPVSAQGVLFGYR